MRKKEFCDFHNEHLTRPFLKNTFKEIWEKEFDLIDATCKDKFRTKTDVNIWIVKDWQMLSGEFVPRTASFSEYFSISRFLTDKRVEKMLKKGKRKCICVNDTEDDLDFENAKSSFVKLIETILGRKSLFEK